jgi:8-oxo-dGTP diphosphatase
MTLQLIPRREVWTVSAFANAASVDLHAKARELGALLEERLRGLTAKDLPRISWDAKLVERTLAMAHSAKLRCTWTTFLEGFPYRDENTGLLYNKLGTFELDVEYFPDEPERRRAIDPLALQQPPSVAAEVLRELSTRKAQNAIRLDTVSPIFVWVVSDEILPEAPPWSGENIRAQKRVLGPWIEIYSGAWPDYTEELYDSRIRGNLSNRLSELHFIRKNSGLIYMAPDNLKRFFDSYMRPFVLAPTAQLRAMHFALMSINESLDILNVREAREDFLDLDLIEEKLSNLRQLRATLQMKMSEIYNELDSNKRQHYTAVLNQLLGEFGLTRAGIFGRVDEKFETLYNSMHHLYQRKEAESQERTQRGLGTLSTLFSLGVFSDFAALLLGTAAGLTEHSAFAIAVNGFFSAVLLVVLILAIASRVRLRLEKHQEKPITAADAVILDGKGGVLVITRKRPPCRGQQAFPGTWVLTNEAATKALAREVKDETNLDIIIERQIGVYDTPGRDPRGRVVSHAFLCRLAGDRYEIKCREDAGEARFVPVAELRGVDLAFDHEEMLADAEKLIPLPAGAGPAASEGRAAAGS